MNKSIIFVLFVSLSFLLTFSCEDTSSPQGEKDNDTTSTIIPLTMRQEHIPWPSLADTPWPMGKHDPQLTGRSQYVGPANGSVKWSYVDSAVWLNSGVALGYDNTIYYTSGSGDPEGLGFATALNTANGSVNWNFETNPLWHYITPLILNDGTIIFGVNRTYSIFKAKVFATDKDGKEKWQYETDGDMGIVAFNVDYAGNIYFTSSNPAVLYSLDSDGKLRFKKDLNYEYSYNGLAFSPFGNIFYLTDKTSLSAYSTNGELIWSFPISEGRISSPPLVDNQGNIYFATLIPDSKLVIIYSISSENEQRWVYEFDFGSQYDGIIDMTMDKNGYIYFNDLHRTVYSLFYNGELRLKKEIDPTKYQIIDSGVICDADDNLYMGVSLSDYISLSSDLEIRWSIPCTEFYSNCAWKFWDNPAALGNGVLYGITVKKPAIIFAVE